MKTSTTLLLLFLFLSSTYTATFAQAPENNAPKQLYKDKNDLVAQAKKVTTGINFEDFKKLYDENDQTLYIDIRTETETEQGCIPGAVLIPRGVLEFLIAKKEAWEDKKQPMPAKYESFIVYCRSGNRAAVAAKSLQELGYANVKYLDSGWKEWHEKYPELIELPEE